MANSIAARSAAAGLAMALCAPGARADVISYTTQAAFNAETRGRVTNNIPSPASGTEQIVTSPFAIAPLTFSSDGALALEKDGFYGAGQTYLQASLVTTETIAASGSTAISFTIGTTTRNELLDIDINGLLAATLRTGVAATSRFVGFTSTDAIDVVTITDTSHSDGDTDILRFQVASAIPEPASLALLCAGLLGLAGLRRRV